MTEDELDGGCFITSVDIFFAIKDENVPVTLELRTTLNGEPSAEILPFGRVVKARR